MRARNIKPGFFINEEVGSLTMTARVLFIGLWCAADKNGFIEYRPQKIKASIFPYDSLNLIKFLEEISQKGLITIWCDKDKHCHFIEIPSFDKHQRPHPNEKQSELKEIVEQADDLIKLHEIKCNYRLILGKRNVDIIIPDTDDGFDKFWSRMVKKLDKAKCKTAWKYIAKKNHDKIHKALDIIIPVWDKKEKQYIPHPLTWLNGERWNDEVAGEVDPVQAKIDAIKRRQL